MLSKPWFLDEDIYKEQNMINFIINLVFNLAQKYHGPNLEYSYLILESSLRIDIYI